MTQVVISQKRIQSKVDTVFNNQVKSRDAIAVALSSFSQVLVAQREVSSFTANVACKHAFKRLSVRFKK